MRLVVLLRNREMGLLGTADAMKLAFQCVRTPSIPGFMSFRPGFGVWFGVRPTGGGPGAPSGSGLEGELSGAALGGAAAEEVGGAEEFRLLAQLAGQAGEAEPAALHDVGLVGQAERDGGELLDQQHAG